MTYSTVSYRLFLKNMLVKVWEFLFDFYHCWAHAQVIEKIQHLLPKYIHNYQSFGYLPDCPKIYFDYLFYSECFSSYWSFLLLGCNCEIRTKQKVLEIKPQDLYEKKINIFLTANVCRSRSANGGLLT